VKSGCDLNCGKTYPNLVAAVREGLITEAEIDVCVRRLLRARFKLGLFDPEAEQPYARIPETVVESEAHRSLARRMAAESLVLLKNEGDLLPLRRDYKCVGVVGPNAAALRPLLGNYYGYSANMVTPLEGILGAVSPGTDVLYDPGVGLRAADADAGIRRAVWVARQSDVVIAVMGLSPELEGEEGEVAESDGGGDRIRIGLPGKQEEMLKALQETGKPVVLVLTCGSPVEIAWAKRNLPAILLAWYPGEEGGNAIADALFGEVSPAGRLPFTVPRSLDQLPPFEDYAMAGRTYRYMTEEPLYRFGFGLSYTTFTYGAASLSRATVPASNPTVEIEVEVANAGARAGDEVVQLYVRDVQASVPVPRHRLEGFRRVHLKPGERRKITFALRPEQLAAHREDGTPFVEPGEFRLFVGGCQPDDPAFRGVEATLRVTG
jgi:beta-glucosidase